MYVLSHGCLLSSYKAFFHLHTWFFSWEASCYESCLVSHDVSIYCMMELQTSLHVSILHPRHHSSWIGLPFLLGYFFITGRLCINDVAQQCHITGVSLRPLSFFWKYHHIILHLGFFLELLSLVLRNKSHPSFLVGDCTRSFLQVKCICMVRNIS